LLLSQLTRSRPAPAVLPAAEVGVGRDHPAKPTDHDVQTTAGAVGPAGLTRPRGAKDVAKDVVFVTLIKTYRLLWVAVALLVAIAFPEIKETMGIVVGVLLIDVLWRAWATRKVGG